MSVNWTAVTTIQHILDAPNVNTGNWFWIVMLFMMVFIILITLLMKKSGTEASVLSSGFVGLVGGIFLTYINLISWEWCLFFVGLIVMTFLYIIYTNRYDY